MANRFKQAAKYQQEQMNEEKTENKQEEIIQKREQEKVEENLNLKNILSNIENKEVSSNYTFYLKKDNVEKLKHIAKQKKISSSKLLDSILSEILSNI